MSAHLKRRIGPWLLTAYGVGVMVGAGIYVLVGAVVAQAGIYAPLAFVIAGLIAAPSALSYAELSTRIPESAGEAAYIERGFGSPLLGLIVGLGIVAAGTVSAAAVLRGGAGYLTGIVDLPWDVAVIGLGVVLLGVALIGVLESLVIAAVFTVVEVIGLAMVIHAGWGAVPSPDWLAPAQIYWGGVGIAASLAFFAFIGFEDIVNMAEEVRNPTRAMPVSIIASLLITTVLYTLVSWAAVRAVPLGDLSRTERPLALVMEARAGVGAGAVLSAIAVVAALNGVLAQLVMAARVLFGLGRRHDVLRIFYRAHPRLGTPVLATFLVGGFVIAGAIALPVADLAGVTSTILLTVFVMVNAALIAIKHQNPDAPFVAPVWVPWVGLVFAFAALAVSLLGGFGGH